MFYNIPNVGEDLIRSRVVDGHHQVVLVNILLFDFSKQEFLHVALTVLELGL